MIFEKPSLRTRVSFAVAMTHLGGDGLLLRDEEVGLGTREPVQDVARVLSRHVRRDHGPHVRAREGHRAWRSGRRVPVINGLTDYSHPCQAMADLMTIEEHFGKLDGLTMAFVGDGNNVARSLAGRVREVRHAVHPRLAAGVRAAAGGRRPDHGAGAGAWIS